MYNRVFIAILFIPFLGLSQVNKDLYSCEYIKKGITDKTLYKKYNGKLILEMPFNAKSVFKIVIEDGHNYYVLKPIMRKIKRTLRKKKCKCISIEKVDKFKNYKNKIIRHRPEEY